MKNPSSQPSRRDFLAAGGAACAAPAVLMSVGATSGKRPLVGSGAHTYEVEHGWGQLPSHIEWGDTHGVVFDAEGLVYITHQSKADEPMDAIVVFDPLGRYVRSFGKEFHGGGHGLELRREGSEEFLYLCDVKNRRVAKLSLSGELVWSIGYPESAGVYSSAEQYCPTNVAFAPDGGFYVADGYGSHYVHRYDAEARWLGTFGGEGAEPGHLRTPHGVAFDNRPSRQAAIVVADRGNARLQYFSAAGEHQGFVEGLTNPCHFSIRGDELLVADLHARLTILDKENRIVTHLGDDPAWTARVLKERLRGKPETWAAGRFVHPHQARFDHQGNILVVEWVPVGRVSYLRRVG